MKNVVKYLKALLADTYVRIFGARGDLSELKSHTAIVRPNELPPEVCQRMVETIDIIASARTHPRIWRDEVGSDTRIVGFEHEVGEDVEYFSLEKWIKEIDAYTGRRTRSSFLMANCVIPKSENRGSGGGLHRDSPFSHQVKLIWYLNDVTTENGPFQYLPETHFSSIRDRQTYPLGEYRFESTSAELSEVQAAAGSLLICDTKCIHGGKPIEAGKRYAVTLYTFPQSDGARRAYEKLGIDPSLESRG